MRRNCSDITLRKDAANLIVELVGGHHAGAVLQRLCNLVIVCRYDWFDKLYGESLNYKFVHGRCGQYSVVSFRTRVDHGVSMGMHMQWVLQVKKNCGAQTVSQCCSISVVCFILWDAAVRAVCSLQPLWSSFIDPSTSRADKETPGLLPFCVVLFKL